MSDRYVIMGVSGCGKSHIGAAFAAKINGIFIDGDNLHPPSNVKKMSHGEPLDDADREPWLGAVAEVLKSGPPPIIVACSALRVVYRDWIRAGVDGPVTFLHLSGTREVIANRMSARKDHFMPLSLLDSQFATLEPFGRHEEFVVVDIDQTPEEITGELVQKVERQNG